MYTYDLVCGDSKLFSVFCDCPKYAFDNLFSNAGELVMVQLMLSSQFLDSKGSHHEKNICCETKFIKGSGVSIPLKKKKTVQSGKKIVKKYSLS